MFKGLVQKNFLISIILSLIYFLVSLLTLKDYGVSWDETIHFRRGQAYLYYFLTGEKDYFKLPNYNLQGTMGDPNKVPQPRRSFYQNDFHNGVYMFASDSGHPPLNDELAALSNFIFFQKLGILDDISAHHLFNIVSSSVAVFVVCYFSFITFGFFAGIVSSLALVTYPLFFGESHFNVKDPAEATFFAGSILFFYLLINEKKIFYMIGLTIFLTLALGTKFNILFLPLITLPYLVFRFGRKTISFNFLGKEFGKQTLLGFIFVLLTVLIIFLLSWPYLWKNPFNLLQIFKYYQEIGFNFRYQPEQFFFFGFNLFPISWIILTTPPIVLVLTFFGLISAWINRKKSNGVSILWLFWFLVPIFRVSLPRSVIYGGDRQIMEFLPAMCLLSGLGAYQLASFLKRYRNLTKVLVILSFLYPVLVLIKLHPNENVYFNSLIGGLKGAREKNFPSWGNSFGNVYKQGIDWLDKNAKERTKLALIQGTPANAPLILLRSDINYDNQNWSGIDRKGEYLMELTFNDSTQAYGYSWEYVNKFLNSVYEVKADGVSILKIWKNDLDHTKDQYKKREINYQEPYSIKREENNVIISFNQKVNLSRMTISYSSSNCEKAKSTFIETSLDGLNWFREKDWIPYLQVGYTLNDYGRKVVFYFAARETEFIKVLLDSPRSCLKGGNYSFSVLI